VVIAEVFENGPAYKAGMQVGDIIVGANGELVTNIDELNSIKNKLKIGDKIKITLIRNRQYMDVEVVLEAPSIKEQTNEQEQQEPQEEQ
jgi:S1-C subfamily serine protease